MEVVVPVELGQLRVRVMSLPPFTFAWGKTWGKLWGWGNPLHQFLRVQVIKEACFWWMGIPHPRENPHYFPHLRSRTYRSVYYFYAKERIRMGNMGKSFNAHSILGRVSRLRTDKERFFPIFPIASGRPLRRSVHRPPR
jgi:hypothetical protein